MAGRLSGASVVSDASVAAGTVALLLTLLGSLSGCGASSGKATLGSQADAAVRSPGTPASDADAGGQSDDGDGGTPGQASEVSAPDAAEASSTLSPGLVLYLHFTDDLQDHSPRKIPVRVVGNVHLADGAAVFPGDGSWLELPALAVALAGHPFAVALWINVTGDAPTYGLLDQKDAETLRHHLHLMLRGSLNPRLGFYEDDAKSSTALQPGRWIHLIFQYTGAQQQIWIDGALDVARAALSYEGAPVSTGLGRTPRWTDVPSHDLEGLMRDFRIYDRALTATEIGALAASP